MQLNLDLVDRYGLPLVMLALMAVAVWRVWRFLQPLVREMLQEQILLIKGLRQETSANTASLQKQSAALGAQAEALTLNAAFLRKIYDSLFNQTSRPRDRQPTLLVVEDSPSDYLLLRKRLEKLVEREGFQLRQVGSLSEAIRELELADAIILDMLLPDASDCRTSELFAELTRLPIILYTGSHHAEADHLAEKIGAEIVRKDQAPELLEAAVARMLRGIHLASRRAAQAH